MKLSLLLLLVSFGAMAQEMNKTTWGHKSELGFIDNSGNTETTTITAGHKSVAQKGLNTFTAEGKYNFGSQTSINDETDINIRNWNALLKYDRKVSDRFSWFIQTGVLGDRFRDIKWRALLDLPGIRYDFSKQDGPKDRDYFYSTLAYRFTLEETYSGSDEVEQDNHQSVLGLHYGRSLNEMFYFLSDLEWIKRYTGDERNEVNFFIGGSSQLSEMFALKVGYEVSYDDTLKDRGAESSTQRTFSAKLIATY